MFTVKHAPGIIAFLILSIVASLTPSLNVAASTTWPEATLRAVSGAAPRPGLWNARHPAEQKALVEAVGSKLLKEAGKRINVDFTIQRNREPNAGASYGKIVVTTGMIDFVDSEDELAVVLGHEIAHMTQGHITKGILSGIALMIGSTLAERAAPGVGGLAQIGGSVFTQKFSRDMEREADYFGMLYAHRAGFDVQDGVDIWERLAIEHPRSRTSGIFSSHPSSVERMERAREIADELQEGRSHGKGTRPAKAPQVTEAQSLPVAKPLDAATREILALQRDAPVRKTPEVVAIRGSRVFHHADCPLLSETGPGDLLHFPSRRQAITSGGVSCEVCRP